MSTAAWDITDGRLLQPVCNSSANLCMHGCLGLTAIHGETNVKKYHLEKYKWFA